MSRFGPYLLFDGVCAEAMTFYQTVFGGALVMTTVGDSPMKAQMPEALHARIVNARLTSQLIDLSASDWLHPTRRPRSGNTVCLYIGGAAYDDLRSIFNRLWIGADPETLDELRELPFGAYGALTDKFGMRWMLQGSPHGGK